MTPETPLEDDLVYIREAATMLNRRIGTLRRWDIEEVLPEHLRPLRGERGWRCWTREQIEGIKEWIVETERFPGKGLPNYSPSAETLDTQISAMRKPRVTE